jgi:hypothetical protein
LGGGWGEARERGVEVWGGVREEDVRERVLRCGELQVG